MSAWDNAGVPDADGYGLPIGLLNAEGLNSAAKALSDLCRTVYPGPGEDRDELISAIASDQIAGAIHGTRNCRADLLQTFVSRSVPFGIVIGFESIDIEHDQRERSRFTQGSSPFLIEEIIELASVGDASQPV